MYEHILPELNAMQQIANIICDLGPAERRRVAAWLTEYASQEDLPATAGKAPGNDMPEAEPEPATAATDQPGPGEPARSEFATFAELYERVSPRKGAQRAAVAGYWLQTEQGQQSWKASEVNKLLKSIDVKVSSMSIVLTNAVKAKEALVVELARLGDGERSRKTFCLSELGLSYVEGSLR